MDSEVESEDSPGYERTSTKRKRQDLVDENKKRKAIEKLRRAITKGNPETLTEWENEFLHDVNARIQENGSAFFDGTKGDLSMPMSTLQDFKLKEISKEMRLRKRLGMKAARAMVFKKMKKGIPSND